MQQPIVALIDLFDPYKEAFEIRAQRERRTVLAFDWDDVAANDCSTISLCVVAVDGEILGPVERIRRLRKVLQDCPIVVIARRIRIDTVVRLIRSGVADVIGLPCDPEDVAARASVHAVEWGEHGVHGLVGDGPKMRRLRRELHAVAPLQSTVLITGETGTGKGVVAREIHRLSSRSASPFIQVDCASLAPTIIESELFGHERGAFTGADQRRTGRFELAENGTIFLDEIGDMTPALQSKLLRVLQDREYERIGGSETRMMTARVVAATNRDLTREVQKGRFRADLMFRLNVFRLHVPSLRERRVDLPALTRSSLERLSERLQLEIPELSESFYSRLEDHSWPGNVRELLNVLERVMIQHRAGLLDEFVLDAMFDEAPRRRRVREPIGGQWDDTYAGRMRADPSGPEASFSPEVIGDVLDEVGGNVTRAAHRLGVPRSTLRYRMRRLGRGPPGKGGGSS